MPVFDFRCEECGNRYQDLVHSNLSASSCPSCSSMLTRRVFGRMSSSKVYTEPMDETMRNAMLKNKAFLESRAEEFLDGRSEMKEQGPREYRPSIPEHLRKNWHFMSKPNG